MNIIKELIALVKWLFTKSLKTIGVMLVSTGLSVLNPELLISIISAVFEVVVPSFEADSITGWALIVFGVSLFFADYFMNKDESKKDKQDKHSFESLNRIIDKQNFNIMLNDIGANNTLFTNHQDVLDDLEQHLDNHDLDVYNKKLKKLRSDFKIELSCFYSFVQKNYFNIGGNRIMLRENLRRTAGYQAYVDQQNEHIEKLRKSYDNYREEFRNKYKI